MRKEDGDLIWVSVSATPETIYGYALTLTIDITERKHAEAERLALLERWNMTAEISSIGIWDWHAGHDEVLWSDTCLLHGLAPGTTLTFADISTLIHPGDFAVVETGQSRKSGREHTRTAACPRRLQMVRCAMC